MYIEMNIRYDPRTIGLAVITSYPRWYSGKLQSIKHTDKVRGDLALEFAQKATAKGFHVVFADRKSSKTFRQRLKNISGLQLITRRVEGRSRGKRSVIKYVAHISSIKVIVIIEPEKVSVIDDCIDAMVLPIFDNKADIVIPRRNDKLFKSTYPAYMYDSETKANALYNQALRKKGLLKKNIHDLDWYFGPRVFKNEKKIVQLFMKRYTFNDESIIAQLFDPDEYSNTQYFPIVNALRTGLRVIDAEVSFTYPRSQKENEATGEKDVFIAKRKHQQISLLIDLMHLLQSFSK
jgi:hypothetical protein